MESCLKKFGEMCIATYRENTHWAKLANQGTPGIWVGYTVIPLVHTGFLTQDKKIILTWEVTFLQQSYSEYTKVEKPVFLTSIYEGSDDEEELKTVLVVNNNNNISIVSDSNNDDGDADIENDKKNFFNEDIDSKVKVTPQTTNNTKVVHAMKMFQPS